MKIIKVKDYEELSQKAAIIVLRELLVDPNLAIGFATGSTPLGLYNKLITAHKELSVDFSTMTTFNLDEYYPMKKENPQGYYHFMFENLFNHINVTLSNLHFLDGMTPNSKIVCARYEKKINEKGIDLQILGVGANGHIGFNEPGFQFNSITRLVDLSEKTIASNARFFNNINHVPRQALSMGISTIMSAKKILLLASGKSKAEAIKQLIEGPIDKNCPVTILQRHPNATLIVDQDATALLQDNVIPNNIRGYHIITENNFVKNKKIIVISPHPDDASICAGGTISLLSDDNEVHVFIMTTGHRAFIPNTTKEERIALREAEAREESKILHTTPHFLRLEYYDDNKKSLDADSAKVAAKIHAIAPDIIFVPQENDPHPTHQMARTIVTAILKNYPKKIDCWSYESPWSLFQQEGFNTIVSLPESLLRRKINAIKTQKSQLSRTRYDIAAETLAQFRGALIPEQKLVGYGKRPIRISNNLELYSVETTDKENQKQ
jgi:glucosamine-6-phosphate deaminase